MSTSNRENICDCAIIAQILLGISEHKKYTTYIHTDFFFTKDRTKQYFPETIKLFKLDKITGEYYAKFFGVGGLQTYVSGAKTFANEYEKLTGWQRKGCYFAVVQPFDQGVVSLCDKIDLTKAAPDVICQLISVAKTELELAKSDVISGIRGLGYGETADEYNNLAHRIEECLTSKK
jgi:hypothetical protein